MGWTERADHRPVQTVDVQRQPAKHQVDLMSPHPRTLLLGALGQNWSTAHGQALIQLLFTDVIPPITS